MRKIEGVVNTCPPSYERLAGDSAGAARPGCPPLTGRNTFASVGGPADDVPLAAAPCEGAGMPLLEARSAMVLLHGRGASAEDILTLVDQLDQGGFAYLAPQAAGSTWYPLSFRAPLEDNEPWLSSALTAVGEVVETVARAGIPADRTLLLGFSQGACLALEY